MPSVPPPAYEPANNSLPVARRADDPGDRAPLDQRVAYRAVLVVVSSFLVALLLVRGYGLDDQLAADGARLSDGAWTSVPWQLTGAGAGDDRELALTVDPSACARVVRYETVETPDTVMVTVWRRSLHRSCVPLSIVVRLEAPLGGRRVVDGGAVSTYRS